MAEPAAPTFTRVQGYVDHAIPACTPGGLSRCPFSLHNRRGAVKPAGSTLERQVGRCFLRRIWPSGVRYGRGWRYIDLHLARRLFTGQVLPRRTLCRQGLSDQEDQGAVGPARHERRSLALRTDAGRSLNISLAERRDIAACPALLSLGRERLEPLCFDRGADAGHQVLIIAQIVPGDQHHAENFV